jgi:hypothetical protein
MTILHTENARRRTMCKLCFNSDHKTLDDDLTQAIAALAQEEDAHQGTKDELAAMTQSNSDLQLALEECQQGNARPPLAPPTSLVELHRNDFKAMIEALPGDCDIDLADRLYKMPKISEVKGALWYFGVFDYVWTTDEFDCDDFTKVLNARFAEWPGWRWTPRVDAWYNDPDVGLHSRLLIGAIDDESDGQGKLFLIEGQVRPDIEIGVLDAAVFFSGIGVGPYVAK